MSAPTANPVLSAPIVKLSARSLFGRSRAALLAALPVLLIVVSMLLLRANLEDLDALTFLRAFGIGVVVPIVVLICTTTLINSEFDDGSILYLLIKPVPRSAIVASKTLMVLAGSGVAALTTTLAAFILTGGGDHIMAAVAVSSIVAAVGYTGVFMLLATLFKRSILGCLGYWLLWESVLSSLIAPTRWLSVRAWANAVMQHISTLPGEGKPTLPLAYALIAALVVLIAGVLFSARRLRAVTLSEV